MADDNACILLSISSLQAMLTHKEHDDSVALNESVRLYTTYKEHDGHVAKNDKHHE